MAKYTSYDDMINHMCDEILFEENTGEYQGDLYYVLRQGDQYGLAIIGYGSCSGCDAYKACVSDEDFETLFDNIRNSIRWFPDHKSMLTYILNDENKSSNWWMNEKEIPGKMKNFLEEYDSSGR